MLFLYTVLHACTIVAQAIRENVTETCAFTGQARLRKVTTFVRLALLIFPVVVPPSISSLYIFADALKTRVWRCLFGTVRVVRCFARVGTKGHSCSQRKTCFSMFYLSLMICRGCARSRKFSRTLRALRVVFSHVACTRLQVQITDKEGLTIRLICFGVLFSGVLCFVT